MGKGCLILYYHEVPILSAMITNIMINCDIVHDNPAQNFNVIPTLREILAHMA